MPHLNWHQVKQGHCHFVYLRRAVRQCYFLLRSLMSKVNLLTVSLALHFPLRSRCIVATPLIKSHSFTRVVSFHTLFLEPLQRNQCLGYLPRSAFRSFSTFMEPDWKQIAIKCDICLILSLIFRHGFCFPPG